MIIPTFVDMLVRKIESGEINPVTGLVFTVEDIKIIEYKNEVIKRLETPTD
ncbi:hypothetical protein [Clostridium cylindrosporum]|uniref:Uncharacterized protein n=1 Tax=Clostridium cylindrosporum DSM 605 TaxID=1121307 RepID=A0A0J8G5Y9_CLOCY|nr:hypothetical protein [Clostridium cylindrosporum]KMT23021.1 hypothetical protein CLCY_7c00680 [Clostridium cylindrosporum DSM 605]